MMRSYIEDLKKIISKKLDEQRALEKYEPESLKINLKKHPRQVDKMVEGKPIRFVIIDTDKN